jgi:hypothetical protein
MIFSHYLLRAALLPAALALGSPAFSSNLSPPSEDISTTLDAADAWANLHQVCQDDYFARTPDDFQESGYLSFYNETYAQLKAEFPKEFKALGEVRLFAQKIANSRGFKCTSQTATCEEFPSCESVLRYSQKNRTAKEALNITRNVMLTLDKINEINKYFKALKVSLLPFFHHQAD